MADIVEALVDGGKASAGPPLGPALGPKGVNIGEVIAAINEKTRAFEGMKVPVQVIIDDKKGFKIKVGTPPTSALIKKELGIELASSAPGSERAGELSFDQVRKIAEMKEDSLLGADVKARMLEVAGTARSAGVVIDGKLVREFQADLKAGVYDDRF